MRRVQCIVMGTPGRDFHDAQTFLRANPQYHVVAFTEARMPYLPGRAFPRELAGEDYDQDIPIVTEAELPGLIARHDVDFVFLSASGLSAHELLRKASIVQSCGAAFVLLGPKQTQLRSARPVIAVTAVRTGAGKSPLSLAIAQGVLRHGRRVAVVRHPQPYGDLRAQSVERFATEADLERHECTLAEREEYTPYIEHGIVVFAGVDYRAVLAAAEAEADVLVWDGGDNDHPFVRPTFAFCVVDALRPGDELGYYPGELNLRAAHVVVINKIAGATPVAVETVRRNIRAANPVAMVLRADLEIEVDGPERIAGRKVLCVEDGPTVTHGGMEYGAAMMAALQHGAAEVIDPRAFAVGSIAELYKQYPHMGSVLPAVGYSDAQRAELANTLARSGAELVLDASPARLDRAIEVALPYLRVRYRFKQRSGPPVEEIVEAALQREEDG